MAVNDPNYRYATQTWEADGVRTQYDIAFDGGYIRQSDVVAFSVAIDPDTDLPSDRQIHALTFLSESVDTETQWKTAQVQITPAVAAGRRVVIFRSTEKASPLVDYTNGSILTEKNLDLANEQAIFGIAEIMDGLNAANIALDAQVQQIVDMNTLINQVYAQVLELLAEGGIVSVVPRVWSGVGNGEDTDFPIEGADVPDSGFYDTYLDALGLEPGVDYSIVMGDTSADTMLRFTTAPADGVKWFTVLRGYARPYQGPTPLTTLRIPVVDVPGSTFFVDEAVEFALLECSNATGCTVTVKAIPVAGDPVDKMYDGSFLSLKQTTDAAVEIVAEEGVTLHVPRGYLPRSRERDSIISLVCDAGDTDEWTLSGDLAVDTDYTTGSATYKFRRVLTAHFTNSTNLAQSVTGCTAEVKAGKSYRILCRGTFQTAATTTGAYLGTLGSGGAAGIMNGRISVSITQTAGASAFDATHYAISGTGSYCGGTGVNPANSPHWLEMDSVFTCTADGNISLRFWSEVDGSAARLNQGTMFAVEEIEVTP